MALDILMTILRTQMEMKADVRNIQRDVQYLHYVVTRQQIQAGGQQEHQRADNRLSQYIPCSTLDELRNLDRRLDVDPDFFKHSVSFFK